MALLKRTGRDYRLMLTIFVVAVTGVLGYVFDRISERSATSDHVALSSTLKGVPRDFESLQPAQLMPSESEVRENAPVGGAIAVPVDTPKALLEKGRKEVDQKRFDQALVTLEKAIQLQAQYQEAYTADGYALLGKKLPDNARTTLSGEIDRNPWFADAYFGLGIALEAMGEMEQALGAMRSYLHLTPVKDPYNKTVITARSAIWEMESRLGRHSWVLVRRLRGGSIGPRGLAGRSGWSWAVEGVFVVWRGRA